ncbi:MAG TPA: hypothetical protein VEP73_11275, partial [Actinomycetota bacterium]|nr:hypothetical protein [Actinomycetota bacterium]
MPRVLTAAALFLAVLLAACTGSTRAGGPAPGAAPSATTTAASGSSASGAGAGPSTTGATTTARTWSSAPKVRTRQVAPAPTLVDVRLAHHDTYDRIVFEFRGDAPGYRVEYVPEVHEDATGDPVHLRGNAFLNVVLTPASMHDPQGASTYPGRKVLTAMLPTLRQARFAGDFEGQVSWGLGLDDTVGFKVG